VFGDFLEKTLALSYGGYWRDTGLDKPSTILVYSVVNWRGQDARMSVPFPLLLLRQLNM
jgi:hypothetical protein